MAWGMFCAIPCPRKVWDSEKYPRMLLSLPLIGLMLGALWALVGLLAAKLGLLGAALMAVLPAKCLLQTSLRPCWFPMQVRCLYCRQWLVLL